MENASKALLMIAGVLIGILILSLAVFLFSKGGRAASGVVGVIKDQQIDQFNRKFDKYVPLDNITIYDVVTLAGFARDYNETNELNSTDKGYITVFLKKGSVNRDISNCTDDEFQQLFEADRELLGQYIKNDNRPQDIANVIGYLPIYKCLGTEHNGPDGRITYIGFEMYDENTIRNKIRDKINNSEF